MSDTVAPALQAAGVVSRSAQVILGGSLGTHVLFVSSDTFPTTTGQALMQSMGQRNYDRMNEQGQNLVSNAEDYAYRFRADLSFQSD